MPRNIVLTYENEQFPNFIGLLLQYILLKYWITLVLYKSKYNQICLCKLVQYFPRISLEYMYIPRFKMTSFAYTVDLVM